ncbi:hypothetical protein ETD86_45800 [Nonomuraea turkmeniaca]|uniref:Uncharacterized protein n=1 Tax=Nonomuraea turkmeniaca TaxID=103838 RepID=A0A5S4EYZ1_9ACTN|nr:hypothetical protein [Nonomuraea turkmeniaca]TMR08890.1 hypothetical protein ETD86_45800 [Nonomuraea turkmeniaca]
MPRLTSQATIDKEPQQPPNGLRQPPPQPAAAVTAPADPADLVQSEQVEADAIAVIAAALRSVGCQDGEQRVLAWAQAWHASRYDT